MTWDWALKQLRLGKKVCRDVWSEGCYIHVNPCDILVLHVPTGKPVKEHRYQLEWYEMNEYNWSLYEEEVLAVGA